MAKENEEIPMEIDSMGESENFDSASPTLKRALCWLRQKAREASAKGPPPQLPARLSCSFIRNDLTRLKQLWEGISDKGQFKQLYGDIALLLDVEVEEELLKAALYFWDPSYRCFTFGKHDESSMGEYDMVPTVEEYQDLLMVGSKPDKVFWPTENHPRKLVKLFGMKTEEIRSYMDGEFLSTSFMMDIVEKNTTTRKGIDVLALLIYGLVLFPRREEYVHMSVTTLFMEIKHQSDSVLTILA